jgi:RecA-family ATPase
MLMIARGLGLAPKFNVRCFNMKNYYISTSTIPDKINEFKPRLVIIDSLHSVCGKLNPNKTSDMSVWAKIKSLCLTKDTTILVAHHISEKADFSIEEMMDNSVHFSGMGSSAIKQQTDTEYIMTSQVDHKAGKIENMYIRPIAKRQAIPSKALVIKLIEPDAETMLFEFGGYYEPDTSSEEQDILLLFESTGNEFTVKGVVTEMGGRYSESAIRKALNSLERKNRLLLVRTRHNLFKYRLPGIKH